MEHNLDDVSRLGSHEQFLLYYRQSSLTQMDWHDELQLYNDLQQHFYHGDKPLK